MSLKAAKDVAQSKVEETVDISPNMKTATFLQKNILSCSTWKFRVSVAGAKPEEIMPHDLYYYYFKWCIGGHGDFSTSKYDNKQVVHKAVILSQSLMYRCLNERQRGKLQVSAEVTTQSSSAEVTMMESQNHKKAPVRTEQETREGVEAEWIGVGAESSLEGSRGEFGEVLQWAKKTKTLGD
ncbi:hypothetical protein UY3_09201 [Chelonia mydas]|uniref:Uncharacterized protein n=1 Tax=Chelonia mydas TaxID=8469 RepID=M7B944_CHEMY|nr:hypothetical protein UY3_09201 [Chelonia mydas]